MEGKASTIALTEGHRREDCGREDCVGATVRVALGSCSYVGQYNTIQSKDHRCDNQGSRVQSGRSRVRTSNRPCRKGNSAAARPTMTGLPAHGESRTTERAEKVALARRNLSNWRD